MSCPRPLTLPPTQPRSAIRPVWKSWHRVARVPRVEEPASIPSSSLGVEHFKLDDFHRLDDCQAGCEYGLALGGARGRAVRRSPGLHGLLRAVYWALRERLRAACAALRSRVGAVVRGPRERRGVPRDQADARRRRRVAARGPIAAAGRGARVHRIGRGSPLWPYAPTPVAPTHPPVKCLSGRVCKKTLWSQLHKRFMA